jgi:hypothetical protein
LVLAALGKNQVERIHNVLDEEPGEGGYRKIKDALLSTHTCWGSKATAVELGGVPYTRRFILADVKFPILGIDFRRQFQLVVDVVGSQLLHRSRG